MAALERTKQVESRAGKRLAAVSSFSIKFARISRGEGISSFPHQ